jgi:PAS domain S-box-containing protein
MAKAGILIVEDSFIVAYHLQKTLESEGYHVYGILDSGERALDFLEHTKPDLVLMDIMLNGQLDGIQTAGVVKSKFGLPVIYITALTDKDTIQRAKVTEPYGYLTKPFEDREIFTVLEMALYKHDIEMRLRKSEEKYFSTVRAMSDALIIVDSHLHVTYLNPAAEKLTTVLLDQAQGKNIVDVLPLQNNETHEFPVNPIKCVLEKEINAFEEGLSLKLGNKLIPVGDGTISSVSDKRGEQIGFVLVFKDLTEKHEHARLLREFENTRIAALIEGQEKERSRIAKDLHDGLGQMLNAIKMNINLLVDSRDKANDIAKLMDEAIQESIRISENLLPSKLKDFDLATCLKSLCKQIQDTLKVSVVFQQTGTAPVLEQNQKVNFYRIAQEAVNNAIRHAQASSITLQLMTNQENIRLLIENNGKGMKPVNDGKPHHGLVNMRERTEMMGGKLIIETDTKRGTLIIAEIPFSQTEHAHV